MYSRSLQALLAALILLGAAARGASAPQVVKARVTLRTRDVRPGASIKATVTASIQPGYHINDHKPSLDYLIPTELKLDPSPAISIADVSYPKGTPKKFSFFDTPISVYEGTLRLPVALKVSPSARPGDYTVNGKLAYQACNDQACLAPTSAPFSLAVKVLPAGMVVPSTWRPLPETHKKRASENLTSRRARPVKADVSY